MEVLADDKKHLLTGNSIGQSYWDNIPTWRVSGSCFKILADNVSGRIPVTRIESWKDFTQLLESGFFNRKNTQLIFRGHRRFDWGLAPTLGRLSISGIVTEELANKQLSNFKQAVRGRIGDNSLLVNDEQDDELWSVGQHHGLMTPLLDWTYSPYVALFFAFCKEDKTEELDNQYRAIYVLNKTFVDNHPLCDDIRVFEPKIDNHGRLVNQAGLFVYPPTDATIENKLTDILSNPEFEDDELIKSDEANEANVLANYICKIYIRNEDQQECLKQLRRMNVHYASLFPDLMGASDYCNNIITEIERENAFNENTELLGNTQDAGFKDEITNNPQSIQVDLKEVKSLIELLKQPKESVNVEAGRLKVIAEEISVALQQNKLIDWDVRDNVQAKLRNTIRVILRKYGYPTELREAVSNIIVKLEIADNTTVK